MGQQDKSTRQLVAAGKTLSRGFYDRDPREVAHDLLGKLLIRRMGSHLLVGRIVETEAYLGKDDPAAHSYRGKTDRNAVMFGLPGFAYVYFIYGMHFCLNVSCLPEGIAGAVLFRAMEPVSGIDRMARLRNVALPEEPRLSLLRTLTSGPGRMAAALDVTRLRDNGKDLTDSRKSDLWLADDGHRVERIVATPRIGITKAVEHPLRYVVAGNPYVSAKRER